MVYINILDFKFPDLHVVRISCDFVSFYLQHPVFVLQDMLALRCVAGGLCGGGSFFKSLHHVQKVFVFSQSQSVRLYGRLPQQTQVRFFSQGQSSSGSAAKLKLRTRLLVTLLFGGGLMGAWWFVHLERQQKLRQQRMEQLQQVALGQGNFSLLDHRYGEVSEVKQVTLYN